MPNSMTIKTGNLKDFCNGDVNIDLLPDTDDTYDLGGALNRFTNVHVNNIEGGAEDQIAAMIAVLA